MQRFLILLILLALLFVGLDNVIAQNSGHGEPAPNSGDCVSDGSGYDAPNGPNSGVSRDSRQGYGKPAPSSGDGIPDGSGR